MSRSVLDALRRQAQGCTACELYKRASKTVFGEGSSAVHMMLIGEQPGDREDIEGLPFVSPAGQLLDRVLRQAGIDRGLCYITNAVKHFKWEPRGKRRLHKTPAQREIEACRRWLVADAAALQPDVLVCLGATAAKAVLGPDVRVTVEHGRPRSSLLGPTGIATMHPSAVLRMKDAADREQAFDRMVADLRVARSLLKRSTHDDQTGKAAQA